MDTREIAQAPSSDKKEIVANLYAIRAGLSVISEDFDKINNSKKSIENQKQRLNNCRKEVSNKKQDLTESQEELYSFKDDVTPRLEMMEHNAKKEYSKKVFEQFLLFIPYVIGCFLAAGLFTVIADFAISMFIAIFIDEYTNFVLLEDNFFVTLTVVIIIAVIAAIIIAITCIRNEIISNRITMQDFMSRSEKNKSKRSELESKVWSNERQLKVAYSNELKCLTETEQLSKQETQNQSEITQHADRVYKALKEAYSSILMEQDWCNIDLLIFYFITGRVDTLKEALQYVDKERQTQRIEQAVRDASIQIRSAIGEAASYLGNILEDSFGRLNAKMNAIAVGISSLHSSIGSLNSQVSRSNAINSEILKSSELNSALLAKANKNSDELTNELKYMKNRFYEKGII